MKCVREPQGTHSLAAAAAEFCLHINMSECLSLLSVVWLVVWLLFVLMLMICIDFEDNALEFFCLLYFEAAASKTAWG